MPHDWAIEGDFYAGNPSGAGGGALQGGIVGFMSYGYSTFEYDITPYVREGENMVAVKVDNSDQPNSRWYSDCGI